MSNSTENTHNVTSEAFTGYVIPIAARAMFVSVGSVMIVTGVIGNALLMAIIFSQFQRKRCVHNLFIANLALSDILTLGYWCTFFVLDLILGYHPVVNNAHCVVNGVIICTLSLVSTSQTY